MNKLTLDNIKVTIGGVECVPMDVQEPRVGESWKVEVRDWRPFVGVILAVHPDSVRVEDTTKGYRATVSRGYLTERVPRLYVAGPMSNMPDLNFPAFHAAARKYRDRGAHVENPAEINPDPGMKWEDAMRADIPRLLTCDTIVMLDGWTASRGAQLEHHIARALGMTVVYEGCEAGTGGADDAPWTTKATPDGGTVRAWGIK